MSFQTVPSEFTTFARYFFDFDYRRPVTDFAAYRETLMRNGLNALDPEHKRALAALLDQCLDGTHSEDEFLGLWRSAGARTIVQPVARFFFADIRSRLR